MWYTLSREIFHAGTLASSKQQQKNDTLYEADQSQQGEISMADASSTGQGPFDIWSKLFEKTLNAGLPHSAATTRHADGEQEEDPWIALINQLWQMNPYSALLPIDPGEITQAFRQLWLDAFRHPARAWTAYSDFVQQYTQLMTANTLKFWGKTSDVGPVVEPEPGDKRFNAPDWQQNLAFDTLKQYYLLVATSFLKAAAQVEGVDEKLRRRLIFYLRQFLDAISPTNFLFTNPQVLHETLSSGGQNLITGMEHLLRDMKAGQIKIADTDAFAPGRNLALTPGQVVYRNKLIELIQYTPATEQVYAIPLFFIPPWINKYYILDMQPQNSLIKCLVDAGFSVFVISWKNPDASLEETDFEDYLTLGALSAFKVIEEITGSPQINAVGYCIGGTLLAMALAYLAGKKERTVNAATFFVSLQDFSEVGDTSVFIDEPQVAYIEGQMMERGYLDSRSMATMFNLLRANDLIWSNVINNYLLGKEPPALDLLSWSADGTRMARAAHSFYLRNTYLENNLIKPGKITLKGVPLDLGRISQDIYAVGAQQDHIVPWKSAWRITQLVGGHVRFVLVGSGHIAGIISPPSKGRGYWINEQRAENPDEWFEQARAYKGSWWTDWVDWLKARSGKLGVPPALGSAKHPPLTPAPGLYVFEK
jgi:polyhydroxyalkanoate synthase